MNNTSTAIIPLTPAISESARALAWGAQQMATGATAPQIKRQMRELYSEARNRGVIRALKEGLLTVSNTTPGGEKVFDTSHEGRRIRCTLYAEMSVQVQLENVMVLDDRPTLKADVVFAPGAWLLGLLEAIEAERWALEQRQAAAEERAALAMVQQIKAGL